MALKPTTILITGASSGIGAALAHCYAAPGITLFLLGRSHKRLTAVQKGCVEKGATAHIQLLDVTDEEAMRDWLIETDQATPFDLVIANAGVSGGSAGTSVIKEDPSQLHMLLDINLYGVINTVMPLIPRMIERQSGHIALMSSLAAYRGLPGAPGYSTSKAAVKTWGEALRGWLKAHQVQVSVICPGYIKTPLTANNPFPMPQLMEADKAAKRIKAGLSKGKPIIAFPILMRFVAWFGGLLPAFIADPIYAGLPAKPAVAMPTEKEG